MKQKTSPLLQLRWPRMLTSVSAPSRSVLLQSVQFSDLRAEEARSRFTEFVELWNAVRLPARLYAGVDGGSLRRTQHSWGRLAGELPA